MQLNLANPTVGDALRPFELPTTHGKPVLSSALAGRIIVLIFYGHEDVPASAETLLAFRDALAQFDSRSAAILGIGLSTSDKQKAFAEQNRLGFLLASDAQFQVSAVNGALRQKEGAASAAVGQPQQVQLSVIRRTLLLAPSQRIVKIYDDPDPLTHPAQVLRDIDELLLRDPARRMINHPPVLLIPDVLPPQLCERLIRIWHDEGNDESGFMKQVDGKTVGVFDSAYKIRRDHFMKGGPDAVAVRGFLRSRVLPAMSTAFNYEATRFEDIRIACYDASRGGYFRAHRDNTTEGTAHRRFAMSLLLNDDYEGGTLRFPEYGLHEYRPAAGSAVIFSCSLLHEATDVTAGRRFVLLTFLYGEKEAKIREEYNLRTGGNYRA